MSFGTGNPDQTVELQANPYGMVLGNERLPSELGWAVKTDPITLETIYAQVRAIATVQNLTTADNSTASTKHRRTVGDVHSSML